MFMADAALSLVHGSNIFEGKLLYYRFEQWRSVCIETWDLQDADPLCKSLGYGHAQSISVSRTVDRKTHDDVTLDRVHCTGDEGDFLDCPGVGDGSIDCNRTGDARVVCSGGRYDQKQFSGCQNCGGGGGLGDLRDSSTPPPPHSNTHKPEKQTNSYHKLI